MSEMEWPLRNLAATVCSVLLGVLVVVQAFINIKRSKSLGNPLRSAAVSMTVGAFSLFIFHNLEQYQWIKCDCVGEEEDYDAENEIKLHAGGATVGNSENTGSASDQSYSFSFRSVPVIGANRELQHAPSSSSSSKDIESLCTEKEKVDVAETSGTVVGKLEAGQICRTFRI